MRYTNRRLLYFSLRYLRHWIHVQCDAWPTVTFPAAERQRPSGGILFDDRDTMVDTAICTESLRAPTRVIHWLQVRHHHVTARWKAAVFHVCNECYRREDDELRRSLVDWCSGKTGERWRCSRYHSVSFRLISTCCRWFSTRCCCCRCSFCWWWRWRCREFCAELTLTLLLLRRAPVVAMATDALSGHRS